MFLYVILFLKHFLLVSAGQLGLVGSTAEGTIESNLTDFAAAAGSSSAFSGAKASAAKSSDLPLFRGIK